MRISAKLTVAFLLTAMLGAFFATISLRAGSHLITGLIIAVGVGVTAGIALLVTRSITTPLAESMDFLHRIGLGDVSGAMPMGTPVNCSSIRNCGRKTCPSYGKVDHCWVSSGSYSVVKHCPRAKKGIPCRTCDLYGAKTEMEELGSIVMGLANYFHERERLALEIAQGDLTKEVELSSDKDALGKAFQIMRQSLSSIIGNVQLVTEEISSYSSELNDTSQTLSQGATEQAAALEEISSSITEMAAQTKLNAENAEQAHQLAGQARQSADKGNNHMEQMMGAMEQIDEAGQSISKIIRVIDEIAFQTNLLALNAAVEAARAGRHGKGFAVVAEEVRNLAARSAKAAKETAELIEGSVVKSKNGMQIAANTAEALAEIVTAISKMTELAGEIAAASNEQAQGIAQINQGLDQVDTVTHQNTAKSEESAAAAEELSGQAEQMRQLVAAFKLQERQTESTGAGAEKVPQQCLT